ncbi:DNA-processing protein DprA [Coprobacter sp.]
MALSKETLYQIALTHIKGMNLLLAKTLLAKTGHASDIFREKGESLQNLCGLKTQIFNSETIQKAFDTANKEIDFIEKNHITPIFFTDPEYPARLAECIDAPALLYYRGTANLNSPKILSIVGTRHATNYGRGFCQTLLQELSLWFPDLLIVSGLAYGIDICAHREALNNNLQTIGILAHGMNTLYPSTHRKTAAEMLSHGGLLTEYSSQHPVHKGNFVARNRIVAGISDATLIVESAEKGGSLITADIAESYHRDVFALPGNIQNEYSKGCNQLIRKNKAALITSAQDIADAMCWTIVEKKPKQASLFPELNDTEALLMNILEEKGECQINQLTIASNLPTSQVLANLLELEFKGMIRPYPGGIYRKL